MNKNNTQTAVEWLLNEIADNNKTPRQWKEIAEQAKAMEQQQMKEMYLKGIENYDPTFKKKSTWTTSKKR